MRSRFIIVGLAALALTAAAATESFGGKPSVRSRGPAGRGPRDRVRPQRHTT